MPDRSFSPATRSLLSPGNALAKGNPQIFMESLSERMLELEAELLAVKRRINPCSPINRLAPELLTRIFLALKDPGHLAVAVTSDEKRESRLQWIWITHVCTYWREVALAFTRLWSDLTDVNLRNLGLVEAFLKRSENSPLTVILATTDLEDYSHSIALVLSHVHRVRTLKLMKMHADSEGETILDRCRGKSAPILESLALESSYSSRRWMYLPATFLAGGCPSLRSLDVVMRIANWETLPLGASLTHLRIACPFFDASSIPPLKEFLGCLDAMKYLKRLDLSNFLSPDPSSGEETPVATTALPSLEHLMLHDTTMAIGTFLEFVRFAKSVAVDLTMADPPIAQNVLRLSSNLHRSWTGSTAKAEGLPLLREPSEAISNKFSVTKMSIWRYGTSPVNLGFPVLKINYADGRGLLKLRHLFVTIDHDHALWSLGDYLRDLEPCLDLTTMHSLTLSKCIDLPREVWNAVFAPLQGLVSIKFDYTSVEDFLVWLCNDPAIAFTQNWLKKHPHPKTPQPSGPCVPGIGPPLSSLVPCDGGSSCICGGPGRWKPPATYIPNLEKVELDFAHSGLFDDEENEANVAETLILVLQLRALVLYPIIEVDIKRCLWVSRDDYETLSTIHPWVNVVWDQA